MRVLLSSWRSNWAPGRLVPTRAFQSALNYTNFRCGLAAGFFAAASFAGFFPAIGISISFCPAAAFLAFLASFFGTLASAEAPPTLRRSAYG